MKVWWHQDQLEEERADRQAPLVQVRWMHVLVTNVDGLRAIN